ncbi:hypothetical protein, partial [Streptomyces hygroscopicus]
MGGTTGATVPKRREGHERHAGHEPAGPPAHAADGGAGETGADAAPPPAVRDTAPARGGGRDTA